MSLYQQLVDKNKHYIDIANSIYKLSLPYPVVKCDITGTTGGWAKSGQWCVNYNPTFLKNHTSHFLINTVGHEIAHLVASKIGGRRHDSIWKSVMHRFGLDSSRTHSYDVTVLPKYVNSMYTYACQCKEHKVTLRIHKSIVSGNSRRCNRCNQYLIFVSAPVRMGTITATIPTKQSIGVIPMIQPIQLNQQVTQPKQPKSPSNKSRVANMMSLPSVKGCTDAEIISKIANMLGVTTSNARTYLYNYNKG